MKKALLKRFDQARFVEPDAFYWPGYIWFWNDYLSKEVLSFQLKDMSLHQAKSVWPLPAPKDFRPSSMPTSLEPNYLTGGYLERYRFMVEEAYRLGMRVWLYDEGGWPSGMVCGRIVKKNPALARQTLGREELKPKKGESIKIPENCLSAFLYHENEPARRLVPGTEEKINIDHTRIEIFRVSRIDLSLIHSNQPIDAVTFYPDLLNPKSTGEFIRMTHEVFKKTVGDFFGTTIPLVFIDEAGVTNLPWTDNLISGFKKKYGYDICEKLPDIFKPNLPEGMQTRIDYYDWWSRRFARVFWGAIKTWCRKNGILLAGHLGGDGDSGTMGARRYGFGHPLRILRELDIPGVDAIWRQIFPGKKITMDFTRCKSSAKYPTNVNHYFPKYASTVAHQEGKSWAITESFAIYGAGLLPEQMKWITDFQYVRGTNIMTMGGYNLSTREQFMAGGRPMYGPFNPIWKYMVNYHRYVARLSYLLSLGKPVIETAVYYPVKDLWAGGPEVNQLAIAHDTLVNVLLDNQCDFDLIDDDVLSRSSTRVVKGRLKAGPMSYRTICVSRTRWMDKKSKEKLTQLVSGGGRVLWVNDCENNNKPEGVTDLGFSELGKYLDPLIRIEPGNKAFRVCQRKLANGNLYFITNESLKETKATFKFAESLPPVGIDPESGACYRLSTTSYSRGIWSIPIRIKFAGSCVILFTKDSFLLKIQPLETGKIVLKIACGWTGRKLKSYKIGKHDFQSGVIKEKPVPVTLGDWRKTFGEDFSGDVEYRTAIKYTGQTTKEDLFLDLGKVNYVCELFLNGKSLGKKAWPPFVFPLKNLLKKGANEIKAVVTNTLANQFVTTRVLDRWPDNITGPYHKIAANFEKESLSSGLFGPVVIKAVTVRHERTNL